MQQNKGTVKVAVKTLAAESASDEEKHNFLKEIRIHSELKNHTNIIAYFGQVSIGPTWIIATEYCSNGSLPEYISKVSTCLYLVHAFTS